MWKEERYLADAYLCELSVLNGLEIGLNSIGHRRFDFDGSFDYTNRRQPTSRPSIGVVMYGERSIRPVGLVGGIPHATSGEQLSFWID